MAYVNADIKSKESRESLGLKTVDIISFTRTVNRINNCLEKQEAQKEKDEMANAGKNAKKLTLREEIAIAAEALLRRKSEEEVAAEIEAENEIDF